MVKNQTFGGVVDQKTVFYKANFEGIVGFCFNESMVPFGMTPILTTIVNERILQRNMFAFYVAANSFTGSKFWLGGVNLQYIKNADPREIKWHRLVTGKWWDLKLDKVLINGVDTNLCSPQATGPPNSCSIIMDSGTSSMAAPNSMLGTLTKKLNQIGNPRSVQSWPDITFVIGGTHYVVPNYAYVTVNKKITFQKNVSSATDLVEPSFAGSVSNIDGHAIWIAGDSFLSQYVSIYDRDNNSVGLVEPWIDNIKKIQS